MLLENEKDFRSNISGGGKAKPYTPTADEKRVAIEACKAVGADFAGVDILFSKNGPIVCEINSNPHFKSTLDCTGVDLSGYILEHIGRKLV
jgi:glutathione synthase/RimK-type ligase-like ATP-grasp enzyme